MRSSKSIISSGRENVVQREIRQKKEAAEKARELKARRQRFKEYYEDGQAADAIVADIDQSLSDPEEATDQENKEAFDELFGDDDTNKSTGNG